MTDDTELDDAQFDAQITLLSKQLEDATAAFDAEAGGISNEIDAAMGATDKALEDFAQDLEKPDEEDAA